MAKKKTRQKRHYSSWTAQDTKTLRTMVKAGAPASDIATKLGRTVPAVRQFASREKISFRRKTKRAK